MEIASLTALALGFIFVSSCDGEITAMILQVLMERSDANRDEKWARFMILGLALLYLGCQEESDTTIETLKAVDHNISKQAQILVEICSWAGSTNVLKVQEMMHHCSDHIEKKEGSREDDTFQAFATIGVALIAMSEDVGAEMAIRQFNHLVSDTPCSVYFESNEDVCRCIMASPSSANLFLSLLVSSVLQTHKCPSSTHSRSTATIAISQSLSTRSLPWASSVQARTTRVLLKCSANLPAITTRSQTAYLWSVWRKVSCIWARARLL